MRFEKPSAIQASTLPVILDGNNVIAQAQSGAGKTVAFVTGMLASIDTSKNVVQALCLTPVRELVFQIIRDTIRPLSSRIPELRAEEALPDREVAKGSICTSHIIVGTPGTVKRWLNNGYLRPSSIKIFVLDEADKMVEEQSLGKDTLMIKQKLNPSCQILFFSATYSKAILDYARKIVPRAYIFTPRSNEELVLDVIFQIKMNVSAFPGGKLQALQDIYDMMTLGGQSIVFVEMKKSADSVTNMMRSAGFEVSSLHGDLLPAERDSVMEEFRKGRSKVLITTNALARGVDVPAVAMVVNFDLPVKRMGQKIAPDTETYLHRIGRCGRFGRRGTAINFIEKPDDFKILDDIEKHYSPTKKMLTEWDPSDIHGLKSAISDRPEGGEVLPEAMNDSKSAATASVDVAVFE